MEQSLWHLTLNTGHVRKSPRSEVDDSIIEMMTQALAADEFDLPGGYRCVLTHRTSKSFEAEVQTRAGAKLVSMGFAAEPSTGAAVWDWLVAADQPQPPTVPWLAVRLHQVKGCLATRRPPIGLWISSGVWLGVFSFVTSLRRPSRPVEKVAPVSSSRAARRASFVQGGSNP